MPTGYTKDMVQNGTRGFYVFHIQGMVMALSSLIFTYVRLPFGYISSFDI